MPYRKKSSDASYKSHNEHEKEKKNCLINDRGDFSFICLNATRAPIIVRASMFVSYAVENALENEKVSICSDSK